MFIMREEGRSTGNVWTLTIFLQRGLSMVKERVTIPEGTKNDLLFYSDNTCCNCRIPGRPVQIHHIDEDPSNNESENLAVLCLLCHDDTQLKGGFGRKLDGGLVRKYRDSWMADVKQRRERARELAAVRMAGIPVPEKTNEIAPSPSSKATNSDPIEFILRLPSILANGYKRAEPKWDSGVTSEMMQGSYELIDLLVELLVRLASYYPANHFGGKPAAEYFSSLESSRFEWHRAHLEVYAPESSGTIVGPMAAAGVLSDLQDAVVEMVGSLHRRYDEFSFPRWKREWSLKSPGTD
jgi:hypothetical protein